MNKITKEDLKKLFDNDLEEISPDDNWHGFSETKSEPVMIKKTSKKIEDHKEIKRVRRQIRSSKQQKKTKNKGYIDQLLKFTAISGILSFFFFLVMNFPGLSRQFQWLYFNEYLNKEIPSMAVDDTLESPTVTPVPDQVQPSISLPNLQIQDNNKLLVNKLKIDAPISWDVSENDIVSKLKQGIVHYLGTSKPGEGGNVFIVGHSSNYAWIKSDYNNVFAILDKLVKGDRIEIRYNNKSFYYDVLETKIVKPNQVEVLSQTNKEILSLMTCWPVGTTLNRMIVIAELKYTTEWSTQ